MTHVRCSAEACGDDITIRPMRVKDCRLVLSLFERCFSHPWSLESIEDMFRHSGYLNLTAWCRGKLIGYAGVLSAMDEADITNVAVDPGYRRRHVASGLLKTLMERAGEKGIRSVYLEVRLSNEEALALYEKAGFVREGIRKNYYDKPREDAVIMKASV